MLQIGRCVMKYPNLVPKSMCKTDINVTIYKEGVSETGAPLILKGNAGFALNQALGPASAMFLGMLGYFLAKLSENILASFLACS